MKYSEMIQEAKSKGLTTEAMMWDSVEDVEMMLCIVEDELRVGIFGTPFAEGLGVEDVVMDDVDVYVNLRRVVVVLEVCRHKSIGVFDAVDEV